jgi:hypothetical protein
VEVNEVVSAADEWARELADTEDEESDAFADTVICGLGWTETRMDYALDPEGRIVDERIDPLEMWAVPQGPFQRNLGNARALIRARYRDKDSLPAKWRKRLPTGTHGASSVDDPTTGWTGPKDDYEREDNDSSGPDKDARKRQVWVRHIQWWEETPIWRIADPTTGQAATVTRKQLKQINEMFLRHGMKPPEAVQIEQRKFYQAVLCGSVFLEPKTEIEAGAFTFKAITGKRDRNANTFYGAVRAMIDPQMWGNKFFVQILHILNTMPKGGAFHEAGVFANPRKALEDWAKPDALIELARGSLSGPKPAIQERQPTNFPAGMDKMMQFAVDSLPMTAGIPMELLGLVERDQPGVLEMQRKKAGYALLSVYFDALRRYRKEKGRVRLYFIQHYISDGRLIRIKGKDSTMRYVPLVKEEGTATYDVIVDEAPMSPNQREQTWMILQAMLPVLAKLPNVPMDIWAKFLEASPLPSSLSSDMIQILQKQAEQPPPPDPEMVKIQAQVEGKKAELAMKAEADAQEAQIEQQRMAQELEFKREEHELKKAELAMKLETEQAKMQLDIQGTYAKAEADQQAMQSKLALDRQAGEQKLALDQRAGEQKLAAQREAAKAEDGVRKGRRLKVNRDKDGRMAELVEDAA